MIVSPTGTGKGVCIAELIRLFRGRGLAQIVPSVEIGASIYTKLTGEAIADHSEAVQRALTEGAGIYTTMRLHNMLLRAEIDPPKFLSCDEAHHDTDTTHTTLRALCGGPPMVGWTATYYRGTPDETAKLKAVWGDPFVALTIKEAVRAGYSALPRFTVWPLLNDETIKITNGEFETKSVESHLSKIEDVVCQKIGDELFDRVNGLWKRSTMVAAPGVVSAKAITDTLNALGFPAVCVVGDTPRAARDRAFADTVARKVVLVQVSVVSEGVDLPVRVQVDLAPCMSPRKWMQRVGRVTRPTGEGEDQPHVYVTNHNLSRFAFLWAGVLPSAQVRDAQQAWGKDFKPSRRLLARAIGLEGFGKFTVSQVPLVDGSHLSLYALQTPDGTHQYAVLLHACVPEPQFYQRTNPHTGETATKLLDDGRTIVYKLKDYGPWKRIAAIPNLEGYVSTKPGPVTPKMQDWWARSAERCGLDPQYVPNNREFQVLPVLINTRSSFRVE